MSMYGDFFILCLIVDILSFDANFDMYISVTMVNDFHLKSLFPL